MGPHDVWRGSVPGFAAGDPDSVQIGQDVTSPFTAGDVLGNPAVNYDFVVTAQNADGTSVPLNRTGEFDFSLAPGQ